MGKYDDKSLQVGRKHIKKHRFKFLERIYFYLIPSAQKRVKWLKKKNKFALLGEHVHWQPRKYPLDGKRLKIHDNVAIASDVEFVMHDVINWVFDGIFGKREYVEYLGCIEIHENVFIGAGSRILPNVSIGPNVIVAAGSLVDKDVPEGTIVGGVPAREIGKYDELMERRKEYSSSHWDKNDNETAWDDFYKKRNASD